MAQPSDIASFEVCCPSCLYNLHGLPEPCVCPECGRHCERHGVIWKPRRPVLHVAISCFTFIFLAVYISRQFLLDPDIRIRIGRAVFFFIELGITALIVVPWAYFVGNKGVYVIVAEDGIRYRSIRSKVTLVPWREIARVVPAPKGKVASIILRYPSRARQYGANNHISGGVAEIVLTMFHSRENVIQFVNLACERHQASGWYDEVGAADEHAN